MVVPKDPRQMELPATAPVDAFDAAPHPVRIKTKLAAPTNYQQRRARRAIQFIVIHCTDGHEGFRKDDDVAAMFAKADLKPRRSCHYVVDTDSVTQCVPDQSIAWHCGKSGNLRGLGIELCGFAKQTRAEWLDALSLPMLRIAARLTRDLCQAYGLPMHFVNAAALRQGAPGITTHAEVGVAWRETNHTDPGRHFPMDLFLRAVASANP
jgi:N-acetyl-anhydromuramyl-L-alanine amidase AmpD